MTAWNVTVQGGWLDGRQIAIPEGRLELVVLEEPRTGPAEWFTKEESAILISEPNRLRLPLEHIAENEYLARWPVREDPRYCPQCACPPESATPVEADWQCRCRFGHEWVLHRRSLANFKPTAWPKALQ